MMVLKELYNEKRFVFSGRAYFISKVKKWL